MASPEYPSGELVSTQLPGHRVGTCSLEACSYPGRIRSGWRAARQRGPFLRGHRVGSSMPDDSLRSHARWSLRVAVFLTTFREIIFRLKSVPAMTGCRLRRLFRHADLTHFLCIVEPKKVGQRNLRIAPFGRDYHAVAAKHGTAPTCGNPCRRDRELSASGRKPETLRPAVADPLVAASLSSSVEGLKSLCSLPRYPFPFPAGETFFYPSSAIKEAKPRPLSLSWGHKETRTKEKSFT